MRYTAMALHLIKLCVGADSVDDLRAWIDFRLDQARAAGRVPEQFHTTRMYPKRSDEIIGQGSLYWVIKGHVQCRQRVLDIRRFTDDEGIGRCNIILEPIVHMTALQPKRPFQGWRYYMADDTPRDLTDTQAAQDALSPQMARDLAELGLL